MHSLADFPDYFEDLNPEGDFDLPDTDNDIDDDHSNNNNNNDQNTPLNHSEAVMDNTQQRRNLQGCDHVPLDFSAGPYGMPYEGNEWVRQDWKDSHGMAIRAYGVDGSGHTPDFKGRLVDSFRPGPAKEIGSPNNKCATKGMGSGYGGQPGQPGENCKRRGNVLVIQDETDIDIPKDSPLGGYLNIYFKEPTFVHGLGLLDINTSAAYVRIYRTDDRRRTYKIPRLGHNSYQDIKIDRSDVWKMHIFFKGPGAVTHIDFCPPPKPPLPPPVVPPGPCKPQEILYQQDFEFGGMNAAEAGWEHAKIDWDAGFSKFLGRFGVGDKFPWKVFPVPLHLDYLELKFDFYEIDRYVWRTSPAE